MTTTTVRFHYWMDRTERRIRCPLGHTFTPDMRIRHGQGELRCGHREPPGDRGQCGRRLLIIVPEYEKYLVVEVSDDDLRHMEARQMSGVTQLAYLLTSAPRQPIPDVRIEAKAPALALDVK